MSAKEIGRILGHSLFGLSLIIVAVLGWRALTHDANTTPVKFATKSLNAIQPEVESKKSSQILAVPNGVASSMLAHSVVVVGDQNNEENLSPSAMPTHSVGVVGAGTQIADKMVAISPENYTPIYQTDSESRTISGNNLSIDQSGSGDMTVTGNNINIYQTGSGDVRVSGNNINIMQTGSGDIAINGSNVQITQEGSGDIIINGNNISGVQAGSGDISIFGNNAIIKQFGSGDVDARGLNIQVIKSGQ